MYIFNINCHQCPEIIRNIIHEKFMFNSWSFVFIFNINYHQYPEIIKNIIHEKFMFNSWSFVFIK